MALSKEFTCGIEIQSPVPFGFLNDRFIPVDTMNRFYARFESKQYTTGAKIIKNCSKINNFKNF